MEAKPANTAEEVPEMLYPNDAIFECWIRGLAEASQFYSTQI